MRGLAGAVNIITRRHDGHVFGMTATAVCSATAEPPTVLACINRSTTTHEAVAKAEVFCVNVLCHEDRELSGLYSGVHGSEMRGEARFRAAEWTALATGAPVLKIALVAFDCRVVNRMVHGTHTIYLGEVQELLLGIVT